MIEEVVERDDRPATKTDVAHANKEFTHSDEKFDGRVGECAFAGPELGRHRRDTTSLAEHEAFVALLPEMVVGDDGELHDRPAHAVPLASARQRPETYPPPRAP